jgi:two-component system, LytTR family, response regulator
MDCLIIDDENHCIKTLTNLLENNFPEVKILGSCNESGKAYELIKHHQPDFIFLDIEMPMLNGFDLLTKFDRLNFEVIFTTAYDTYAIKAIRYSALDYLLKPIDLEDLTFAIEKLKRKPTSISKAQVHVANVIHNKQMPETIALPASDGLIFIPVNDIVYCTADGSYTRIQLIDKSEMLLSKTLGDIEEILGESNFFRIHHSTLVNLKQVRKYIRGEGGEVIMSNGKNLMVARTRKIDFLNIFTRL